MLNLEEGRQEENWKVKRKLREDRGGEALTRQLQRLTEKKKPLKLEKILSKENL